MNLDHILKHSYRDFHAKGLDYICLKRSPNLTIKLYFFEGDVSKLPEVVNPHDHRYDFDTTIICGRLENVWFDRCGPRQCGGEIFNEFRYSTPLNGGNGFTFLRQARLRDTKRTVCGPNETYFMRGSEFHTIRVVENETVIMLCQYEDMLPITDSTVTFVRGDAPKLDGLYNRFKADEVIARLNRLNDRTGIDFGRIE